MSYFLLMMAGAMHRQAQDTGKPVRTIVMAAFAYRTWKAEVARSNVIVQDPALADQPPSFLGARIALRDSFTQTAPPGLASDGRQMQLAMEFLP